MAKTRIGIGVTQAAAARGTSTVPEFGGVSLSFEEAPTRKMKQLADQEKVEREREESGSGRVERFERNAQTTAPSHSDAPPSGKRRRSNASQKQTARVELPPSESRRGEPERSRSQPSPMARPAGAASLARPSPRPAQSTSSRPNPQRPIPPRGPERSSGVRARRLSLDDEENGPPSAATVDEVIADLSRDPRCDD
jgi:hypothetical protein